MGVSNRPVILCSRTTQKLLLRRLISLVKYKFIFDLVSSSTSPSSLLKLLDNLYGQLKYVAEIKTLQVQRTGSHVPDRFPLSALSPFLRRKYGWLTKGGLAPKISITDEDLTARVKGRTATRDFF